MVKGYTIMSCNGVDIAILLMITNQLVALVISSPKSAGQLIANSKNSIGQLVTKCCRHTSVCS